MGVPHRSPHGAPLGAGEGREAARCVAQRLRVSAQARRQQALQRRPPSEGRHVIDAALDTSSGEAAGDGTEKGRPCSSGRPAAAGELLREEPPRVALVGGGRLDHRGDGGRVGEQLGETPAGDEVEWRGRGGG